MVLGQKDETPEEREGQFRLSGSLHLFAVSGRHLAIFASLAFACLRLLRVPQRLAAALVIPFLFYYAILTMVGNELAP